VALVGIDHKGREVETVNKVLATIFAIGAFLCTGCEEKDTNTKFKLILSVVENGTAFSIKTYLGTVEDTAKDIVTGYLNDVATVIQTAADSGEIEPAAFKKYITEQIDKQVAAPYNSLIVTTLDIALDGYNKFYAANVKDKLENEPKAKAVINAIVNGILLSVDPVASEAIEDKNPLEDFNDWSL